MIKLLLFCVLVVAASVQATPLNKYLAPLSGRIIGGQDTVPHQHTFICSVQFDNSHICGASIVTENWILTAAHCIFPASVSQMSVFCGKWDLSQEEFGEQRRPIDAFVMHEIFANGELPETFPWDIAMIYVNEPINFSATIQPTRLPPREIIPHERDVTIIGWGIYDYVGGVGILPDRLQYADIPLLTPTECTNVVGDFFHDHFLCTGPTSGGFGACSGDSGGPMIQATDDGQFVQVGVAAWAFLPCGQPFEPSGYVAVHEFLDWIDETMAAGPPQSV